jgi:Ca2+/Na+ antiporter
MAIDFGVMILLTVLVWLFAWRRPHCISRIQAGILLTIYIVYIAQLALYQ